MARLMDLLSEATKDEDRLILIKKYTKKFDIGRLALELKDPEAAIKIYFLVKKLKWNFTKIRISNPKHPVGSFCVIGGRRFIIVSGPSAERSIYRVLETLIRLAVHRSGNPDSLHRYDEGFSELQAIVQTGERFIMSRVTGKIAAWVGAEFARKVGLDHDDEALNFFKEIEKTMKPAARTELYIRLDGFVREAFNFLTSWRGCQIGLLENALIRASMSPAAWREVSAEELAPYLVDSMANTDES